MVDLMVDCLNAVRAVCLDTERAEIMRESPG